MANKFLVNPAKFIGHVYSSVEKTVTREHLLLYALSLGFANNNEHMLFTYEAHPNFQVFPTFSSALAHQDFEAFTQIPPLSNVKAEDHIVHGEEETEIVRPMVTEGKYRIESKVVDVQDKGKLTVFINQKTITLDSQVHTRILSKYVVRHFGGFGFPGTLSASLPPKPSTVPDRTHSYTIPVHMPMLYRLNGDYSALHVDT